MPYPVSRRFSHSIAALSRLSSEIATTMTSSKGQTPRSSSADLEMLANAASAMSESNLVQCKLSSSPSNADVTSKLLPFGISDNSVASGCKRDTRIPTTSLLQTPIVCECQNCFLYLTSPVSGLPVLHFGIHFESTQFKKADALKLPSRSIVLRYALGLPSNM